MQQAVLLIQTLLSSLNKVFIPPEIRVLYQNFSLLTTTTATMDPTISATTENILNDLI